MADCRTGTAVHDSISRRIAEANPVVSLYGGDLCLNSSYSMFKAQFFMPSELNLISRVPFFNTVGNHEKWSPNTQAFTQAPTSASGTQAYYSFDYGDMHVLVLNNEIPDDATSPQYQFARTDLSTTKRAWKVVICHRPAYCAGGHGDDKDMKIMSETIFEPNHVDVVLSGHSHFFQHNLVNGIHHMVLGSAGAPLYDLGTAPYVVKAAKDYSFGIVDVSPTSFRMMVYNERGMPLDTLILNK
jgi:predicted phosphodiesterase